MVGSIGIVIIVLDYQKNKANNPHAVARFSKQLFGLTLVAGILNSVTPILEKFTSSTPEPVTKEELDAAFKEYQGEKPENQPSREVKSEIEKEISAAFREKDRRVLALYNQGNEAYQNNRFKESITFYNAALEIAQTASIHLARGNSHAVTSSYHLAIQDYNEALERYRKARQRQGEGYALGSLGLAYTSLGQYDHSIEYFTQALAISREIGDRHGEGNVLDSLGLAYSAIGQYDKAIEYFTQALAIFEQIKSPYADTTANIITKLKAKIP